MSLMGKINEMSFAVDFVINIAKTNLAIVLAQNKRDIPEDCKKSVEESKKFFQMLLDNFFESEEIFQICGSVFMRCKGLPVKIDNPEKQKTLIYAELHLVILCFDGLLGKKSIDEGILNQTREICHQLSCSFSRAVRSNFTEF